MKSPSLATWDCVLISKQFAPSRSWIRTVIHHANSKGKIRSRKWKDQKPATWKFMSVFMCRLLHHKQISHFNTTEQQKENLWLVGLWEKQNEKQHSCESQNLSCTLVKGQKALCYAFYLLWEVGFRLTPWRGWTMTGQFPCAWSISLVFASFNPHN